MSTKKELADVLKVEGIMAQGYGLNPKIVMRDKRLSPEAKAIYGYFSSFAGSGNQAFPSRDLMLSELGMSKNRYYKHLGLLLDCDYIRIEKTKTTGNLFSQNIYTIVALPDMQKAQSKKQAQSEEKTANEDLCENERKNRSRGKIRPLSKVKTRGSIVALRERLCIEQLKTQMPEKYEIIESTFMAIEDMAMSEQINIGGTIRTKEAVYEIIERLSADNIRFVVENISQSKKTITNKKAYIQACLINSVFDMQNINNDVAAARSKKDLEEQREAEEKDRKNQIVIENYKICPDLERIDKEINKMAIDIVKAKAVGNQKLAKELEEKNQIKLVERQHLIEKYDLKECS